MDACSSQEKIFNVFGKPLSPVLLDEHQFSVFFPSSVMGPKETIQALELKNVFKIGGIIHVNIVSVYSPVQFYFNTANSKEKLDKLLEELECFYLDSNSGYKIPNKLILQKNQVCAARFSGNWYRAEIIAVPNEVKVYVRLIDLGRCEYILQDNLRFLPKTFAENPRLALPAALSNVCAKDGEEMWPEESIKRFSELVVGNSVVMEVVDINYEKNLVIANLHTREKSSSVNDILVQEGRAMTLIEAKNKKAEQEELRRQIRTVKTITVPEKAKQQKKFGEDMKFVPAGMSLAPKKKTRKEVKKREEMVPDISLLALELVYQKRSSCNVTSNATEHRKKREKSDLILVPPVCLRALETLYRKRQTKDVSNEEAAKSEGRIENNGLKGDRRETTDEERRKDRIRTQRDAEKEMKKEPDETEDWEPILVPRKTKKVPKLKVPESENNPVEDTKVELEEVKQLNVPIEHSVEKPSRQDFENPIVPGISYNNLNIPVPEIPNVPPIPVVPYKPPVPPRPSVLLAEAASPVAVIPPSQSSDPLLQLAETLKTQSELQRRQEELIKKIQEEGLDEKVQVNNLTLSFLANDEEIKKIGSFNLDMAMSLARKKAEDRIRSINLPDIKLLNLFESGQEVNNLNK